MAQTRQVVWSDKAVADLEAAYEYFLGESPSYAAKFLWEIEHKADSLAELSERGRVVPELGLSAVRELIVEKHRLVYRVEPSRVVIARLIHGRRDFKTTWKSSP